MATRSIGFSFRTAAGLFQQLGFGGTCSHLPWTLRRLQEETWERYPGGVPTTAATLVVREASRWSAIVSHEPYYEAMHGDEEDDRPTMGTLWNWCQVRSQQI